MSNSSSSGGIGIGTIIVCAFIFNILFCDDDKTDVKEIVVETQEEVVDESKKEIKDNLQDVVTSAKEAFKGVKNKVREELNIKKEGEQIDKAQDKQTSEKEVVERRIEKEKVEMDTKPMEKGTVKEKVRFKKL